MASINEASLTRGAIADELFIQMCDRGPIVVHPCIIERKCTNDCGRVNDEVNKYYFRAAKYAGRISAGNFSGRNAKHRPVFEADFEDFTPELQHQLRSSKEYLDLIMTEGIFKLLRARHRQIFYEHIQLQKLRWKLNGFF